MTIRVRLIALFSLCAIGALSFFGFIAYDTAARDNDAKAATLLRQVFEPFAPRLARAIRHKGDAAALVARLSDEYQGRLAIAVVGPRGAPLAQSPNYQSFRNGRKGLVDGAHHIVWLKIPIPATRWTARAGFKADAAQTFSYLRQIARSLILAAAIILWLTIWAAVYISKLIEELHRQRDALRHLAQHDTLTDLPNRSLLCQRLKEAVQASSEEGKPFSLCFIDLDRFKEVNDTQGHLCGDKLLTTIGQRLKHGTRGKDTVARLGGDEFAIVLRDIDRSETESILKKLIASIEDDVLIDGGTYRVSCSIGIALYPDHGEDPQTLLMHADIAMYAAKTNGLHWTFFQVALLSGDNPCRESGTLVPDSRGGARCDPAFNYRTHMR